MRGALRWVAKPRDGVPERVSRPARQIRYQGWHASQCGQATVVETGARNT